MKPMMRLLTLLLVAVATATALASPAAAHTSFESSDPGDGDAIDSPVEVITLVFSGEAEPTGNGFQVLDPSGTLREPTSATSDDGLTWVLRFDPALAGGTVGVRWEVKAPDAHPIDGSFSFSVAAAPAVAPTEPADAGESSAPATVPEAARDVDAELEAFLDTGDGSRFAPSRVAALGRVVGLAGTLIGIGALAFAALVLRGDWRDVRHVLHWVRRAGVFAVAGALTEFVAQVAIEGGSDWSAVWSPGVVIDVVASSFGIAAGLRILGGCLLATGARLDIVHAEHVADPVVALKQLVGVGAAVGVGAPVAPHATGEDSWVREPYRHRGDAAWQPVFGSTGALFGALALIAAHLFDGHTVTEGSRLWTGIADAVHVAGGAVWVGGVLMLCVVLWRRHHQGREARALQLAVRFSVVATVALVAVGVAGIALAAIILDAPSDLWATEWGRTLIAKTLLVAAAAAAGGYNHAVVIPRLEAAPDNPAVVGHFRSVIAAEAALLVAVVVVTGLLMGASST